MQGGRGRGNPFFSLGDPFAGFEGMPSLFGGRDPFDDPFFRRPFGGVFPSVPGGSPFMDMTSLRSSLFGPRPNPSMDEHAYTIHESRPSLPINSRGPIIVELTSDDENELACSEDSQKENSGKQPYVELPDDENELEGSEDSQKENSGKQPYVEHPDDEFEGRESRDSTLTQVGNDFSMMNTRSDPQTQSFAFQSSTVTYGGSDGAYYTSSTTKRTSSDGLRFEEYKEADSVTGQAAHRLSRGIHDKGHTVTRNLKSDGQVDTMQVLHNINEDELGGFEEAWKGKTRKHLPGLTGSSTHQGLGEPRGGWALPSVEHSGQRDDGSISRTHVGVRRRPDADDEDARSSKVRRR